MPGSVPGDDAAGAVSAHVEPLHLLKMAVGITDIDDLRRVRAARTKQNGGSWVYTRNRPRRAASVLAGGSIYWVIRGQIQVRQVITGLRSERDAKGRAYCQIEVDPELVATLWRRWRPFQGWRYLAPSDAPPDAPATAPAGWQMPETAAGAMPEHLVAELRALGLW
jgi:hypothetical protein